GARNCVIETIKRAEDGRGTIVRLYEGERNRGPVTLHFGVPVARVFVTNLLEEDAEELSVENGAVRLMLKPYQIITLRLVPPG
ncbi:MAG: glycosyl hydrolase-related protein, partial [Pseudomonadota bacterium]